jgi:hypothetical protein
MLRRLIELFTAAIRIFQTEGLLPLLSRGSTFLLSYFFKWRAYYLYEIDVSKALKQNKEADLLPKVQNFTLKIVYTSEQADGLVRGGFDFQDQATTIRKRLSKGAIAFCIFVGHELANIGWITLTQQAKDSITELPYKVDFANNEACTGSAVTAPKYRNKGLMRYNYYKRLEFLKENGVIKDRAAVSKSNIASQMGVAKISDNIYAEARFLKLLWWKFWWEKPLTPAGI